MIIISPSKTLGKIALQSALEPTQPILLNKSVELVALLKKMSLRELTQLLAVNPKLGQLNFERYLLWQVPFTPNNSSFALGSFKGDVYEGIEASSLTPAHLQFAQQSLRILSGLYGILRPFDLFQPYRLEMGTKLSIGNHKNLYGFWGSSITEQINAEIAKSQSGMLVNLASKEYFSAIDFKSIRAQVITPEFRQYNNGNPKMVPILAKRARGLMTRFIITNRIEEPEGLLHFDFEGYGFYPELSTETAPVFVRYV